MYEIKRFKQDSIFVQLLVFKFFLKGTLKNKISTQTRLYVSRGQNLCSERVLQIIFWKKCSFPGPIMGD